MSETEDSDSDLTDCLAQFVDTPFRERLKESEFYCDGNKVRLFQDQQSETFACVLIGKIPSSEALWWTESEQNRSSRRIQGQWPFLDVFLRQDNNSYSRRLLQTILIAESHRVLKSSGYVVVQCDPSEEHVFRVALDQIYGANNYANSIPWDRQYNAPSSIVTRFATVHDRFVIYRKTAQSVFRPQRVPSLSGYVRNHFWHEEVENRDEFANIDADDEVALAERLHARANAPAGRKFRIQSPTGSTWGSVDAYDGIQLSGGRKLAPLLKEIPTDQIGGTEVNLSYLIRKGIVFKNSRGTLSQKQYADNTVDRGEVMTDLWRKIPYSEGLLHPSKSQPTANEQCIDGDVGTLAGAVTRLVESLTHLGDRVLLPACSEVATVEACVWKQRSWVAFGSSIAALTRLEKRIGRSEFDEVRRVYNPTTHKECLALRARDPKRMECQRVSLAALGDAIGAESMAPIKRGADGGVDGSYNVFTIGAQAVQVICSVKSGGSSVRDVRELHSVIQQRGCQIGVLLLWERATKPMEKEIRSINRGYAPNLGLQIVQLKSLLQGRVAFNFLKAGVEVRTTA